MAIEQLLAVRFAPLQADSTTLLLDVAQEKEFNHLRTNLEAFNSYWNTDMDLFIVDLLPAHRPALRQLYVEARVMAFPWADPIHFHLQDFDAVTDREQVAVALYQGTPVGFIAWWPPDNFIHSLFVQPALLGQGIGHRLLQHCLQQVGRPATLKCLRANTAALRFYARQRWQVAGSGESDEGEYLLLTYPR